MNNHTGPVAIDDDTRELVLELCKAAHEHVAVWTYPYGKQVLALAKQIRERLEAGEVEQARKPLTDEQIDVEFDRETWVTVVFADGARGIALDRVTARDFARAIEAAHGITDD